MRSVMRGRGKSRFGHDSGTLWISFSDLMSALMLIFVLILFYAVYQYYDMLEVKTAELLRQSGILDQQSQQLTLSQRELEDSQKALRLFNEPAGREYLKSAGVPEETLNNLDLFGISGIANMLCAIKMAKYYELTEHDVVASVMTDSAVMYASRVKELQEEDGAYTREMAAVDFHTHILGEKTDNMLELTYPERQRVHNLKYYTWVEQQGKTSEELQSLWYDTEHTWDSVKADAEKVDELIRQFNEDTGLLKNL